MWELDCKEGRVPKNWCFQIVVLEKTLESPLDSKEIKPVNPKGNQPWIFIGRTDAEAEAPILWLSDVKSRLIGKDPGAGKDRGQEEKGSREDEMVGWHLQLDGHEFQQTLGDSEGKGSLVCCSSWGCKELDMTEQLNNSNNNFNTIRKKKNRGEILFLSLKLTLPSDMLYPITENRSDFVWFWALPLVGLGASVFTLRGLSHFKYPAGDPKTTQLLLRGTPAEMPRRWVKPFGQLQFLLNCSSPQRRGQKPAVLTKPSCSDLGWCRVKLAVPDPRKSPSSSQQVLPWTPRSSAQGLGAPSAQFCPVWLASVPGLFPLPLTPSHPAYRASHAGARLHLLQALSPRLSSFPTSLCKITSSASVPASSFLCVI